MIVVETIAEVRAACDDARGARRDGRLRADDGLLPRGPPVAHARARAAHDFVVVTLFVNPTQFGPNEDLDAYPRDLEGDRGGRDAEGVDVLFVPPVDEMYPTARARPCTSTGSPRASAARAGPAHFDGVTTVVAKLFSIVGPCTAYFGRKDAQQLAVIRRMAADLDLPVEVVGCPLVREPDGLAMSSRNAYLDADDRRRATVLVARAACRGRGRGPRRARRACRARRVVHGVLDTEPAVAPRLRRGRRRRHPAAGRRGSTDTLIALAAYVGTTRLIDNIAISFDGDAAQVDLGPPHHGKGGTRCTGS